MGEVFLRGVSGCGTGMWNSSEKFAVLLQNHEGALMKVRDNYIFRDIAQEHLLIPTGEAALSVKGLIALSESGSLLYQKLLSECTREDLICALTREYDVDVSTAGEDVDAFLEQMRQLNMLEE